MKTRPLDYPSSLIVLSGLKDMVLPVMPLPVMPLPVMSLPVLSGRDKTQRLIRAQQAISALLFDWRTGIFW